MRRTGLAMESPKKVFLVLCALLGHLGHLVSAQCEFPDLPDTVDETALVGTSIFEDNTGTYTDITISGEGVEYLEAYVEVDTVGIKVIKDISLGVDCMDDNAITSGGYLLLNVEVTCAVGGTESSLVTFNINPANNRAPLWNQPTLELNDVSKRLFAGLRLSYIYTFDVTVQDMDSFQSIVTDNPLSYTIQEPETFSIFEVVDTEITLPNPSCDAVLTGQDYTAFQIDFELTVDLPEDVPNPYIMTVIAEDSVGATGSLQVTLNFEPEDLLPPVFGELYYEALLQQAEYPGSKTLVDVGPNGISATDGDVEIGILSDFDFESSDECSSSFSIESSDGVNAELYWIADLPQSCQDEPAIVIVIKATQQDNPNKEATMPVSISILDNDKNPKFDSTEYTGTVAYNGDVVLDSDISATDPDTNINSDIMYSLSGSTLFDIDSTSGEITSISSEFSPEELANQHPGGIVRMEVTATEAASSERYSTVPITLTYFYNDEAPIFQNSPYEYVLNDPATDEEVTPMGEIFAQDTDAIPGASIEYVLEDNPYFTASSYPDGSVKITYTGALSASRVVVLEITATEIDAYPIRSSTDSITIDVRINEADVPPAFTSPLFQTNLPYHYQDTPSCVVMEATPQNGVTYEISDIEPASAEPYFDIDASTGVISCDQNDLELTSVFITVTVTDTQNSLTDMAVAGIAIDPRNYTLDDLPSFSESLYVKEDVLDYDFDDVPDCYTVDVNGGNEPYSYEVVSVEPAEAEEFYPIDAATGVIACRKNSLGETEVLVNVRVTDSSDTPLTDEATVAIQIEPVPELADKPTFDSSLFTAELEAPYQDNENCVQITASGGTGSLTYSSVTYDPVEASALFPLNSETGWISCYTGGESLAAVFIAVQVTDEASQSDRSAVGIRIIPDETNCPTTEEPPSTADPEATTDPNDTTGPTTLDPVTDTTVGPTDEPTDPPTTDTPTDEPTDPPTTDTPTDTPPTTDSPTPQPTTEEPPPTGKPVINSGDFESDEQNVGYPSFIYLESFISMPLAQVTTSGNGVVTFDLTGSSQLYIDEDLGLVYSYTSTSENVDQLCSVQGCEATVRARNAAFTSDPLTLKVFPISLEQEIPLLVEDDTLDSAEAVLNQLNNGDFEGVWFRSVQYHPSAPTIKDARHVSNGLLRRPRANTQPEIFVTAFNGTFMDKDTTLGILTAGGVSYVSEGEDITVHTTEPDPSNPTGGPDNPGDGGDDDALLIVVIILAILLTASLVGLLFFFYYFRKKRLQAGHLSTYAPQSRRSSSSHHSVQGFATQSSMANPFARQDTSPTKEENYKPANQPTDVITAGTSFQAQAQYGQLNEEIKRTFSSFKSPEQQQQLDNSLDELKAELEASSTKRQAPAPPKPATPPPVVTTVDTHEGAPSPSSSRSNSLKEDLRNELGARLMLRELEGKVPEPEIVTSPPAEEKQGIKWNENAEVITVAKQEPVVSSSDESGSEGSDSDSGDDTDSTDTGSSSESGSSETTSEEEEEKKQ